MASLMSELVRRHRMRTLRKKHTELAGQLKVLLQRKKQEDYLRSLPPPPEPYCGCGQAMPHKRSQHDHAVERWAQGRAQVEPGEPPMQDWMKGLGPKVRETKQVKYKIGVGDAHNPVLDVTATSDEDAVAQAKKLMKKKLNAGEVREPKFGWVFHILERS